MSGVVTSIDSVSDGFVVNDGVTSSVMGSFV